MGVLKTEKKGPIKITEYAELIPLKWKTEECGSRPDCWCMCIAPAPDVEFQNGDEAYIVGAGSMPRELAQHIVEVHNRQIEGT